MSVYAKENPEFLQQSIDSMLCQSMFPDDFVLVCDGSLTNALDQLVEEYRARYGELFQIIRLPENIGLGPALNEGLKYCKNELVARMDSDDVAFPDRCRRQLQVFGEMDVDIVGGAVREFLKKPGDISRMRAVPQTHSEILKFARLRNPFNHPSVIYKKIAVMNAGGYEPFHLVEDYYLWAKMLQNGAKGYNLQTPVLYMRCGSGLYERRGGWQYFRSMLAFRWALKRIGFIGWISFLKGMGGQGLVCLLPVKIRQKIYQKVLRKQGNF
jgi:glycosyltransferase involved in cell wall biosynthesis